MGVGGVRTSVCWRPWAQRGGGFVLPAFRSEILSSGRAHECCLGAFVRPFGAGSTEGRKKELGCLHRQMNLPATVVRPPGGRHRGAMDVKTGPPTVTRSEQCVLCFIAGT
jgi:hypothetical protein